MISVRDGGIKAFAHQPNRSHLMETLPDWEDQMTIQRVLSLRSASISSVSWKHGSWWLGVCACAKTRKAAGEEQTPTKVLQRQVYIKRFFFFFDVFCLFCFDL